MLTKHHVVMLACFMTALLTGCTGNDQKAGAPPRVAEVGVVEIAPQNVKFTTELSGRTSAYLVAEVRPQISGIIQKRFFTEGTDVKSGESLYKVDPATYQASYDSAKAALTRAEANVMPARLKAERNRELVAINAVSKEEYENADAALKQIEADIAVAKASVQTARINLNYTNILAPISGRIGKSAVTPGALVTANQASPLATIQQLDPMYVDVTQSSMDVLRLREGLEKGQMQLADAEHAKVKLILEDGSVYAHEGTLQFSDVTVDQSTGAITLRAVFPNPKQQLLPGMYVRAELTEGVDDRAILVPQRAVIRDSKGNASVKVVGADNKVQSTDITTGRSYKDQWRVLSGLKAGDKVIVEGLQKAQTGAEVQMTNLSEKKPEKPSDASR